MTLQPLLDDRVGAIQRKPVEPANPIAVVTPKQADPRPVSAFPWAKVLVTIWITGVAIVYLRSVWQHWLLRRMLRRCSKLEGADWQSLLSESADLLGVGANVELLQHDAAISPVTAGAWRPVVVLPADARSWSRDHQRLVLLHELAHVSRRDVFTQTLAGLVCGLHWFNPLFWFGLLQMRKLRELACDDLVLSCGQQPAGYADVLLDIAKSYRHQTYASAVGMARNSNVESRIMAILDKTRRHVKLSPNAARMLFVFAAALLCVVATAQLRTQAELPAPAAQEEQPIAKAADESDDEDGKDMRTMKIRIVDDEGNPLTDATMTVGVIHNTKDYPDYEMPRDHTADDNGTVLLRLPKRVISMQMWTWQSSHVGKFKGYPEGTHDEGKLIPDELEFRLAKGHPIGGRIVDAEGKPIAGVKVEARLEDGPPTANMWLSHSNTDTEGRWQLNSAPARPDEEADYEFGLNVSHEGYISDENWGDAQKANGVGSVDLRRGDAKIVLKRGTSITGAVVDVEGKPITKGWVVWSDEPYFSQGVWEAELDSDGRYRTPPLPDGEYPITIVAPGYAAQRRVVKVGSDSREQPFELRAGKRITIKFVDLKGAPVPRAGITIANSSFPDAWQRSNALHNHKHCDNVPDYGIPRWADAKGVFVWDWAPEEPVKYSMGAKGFASQKLSLVPKDEPHIITLAGKRIAAGEVTDAVTGKPIKSFSTMPVIVFGPDHYCTRFTDLAKGNEGHYELPLTGSGDPSDHYRVRIEADGYRSVISSESFGPTDGRAALDIQLEPAPKRKGLIVDPEGTPVANAKILEGTSTWIPRTDNGEPENYGSRVVMSDSEGRFELNATTELVLLRVLHEKGMAEKLIQPEEDSIGELELKPWATVSGRLMQNGKPVGNQSIFFSPLVSREQKEPRFQDSYYATTAFDGSFTFNRLPSQAGTLRPRLGPWRDSPLTSAKCMPLNLKPGADENIVFGGEGTVVTGQIVATGRDEVPLDHKYSINYLISRDRGLAPTIADGLSKLSFDPSSYGPTTPLPLSWTLDKYFNSWLATRENHFVKLTSDGSLRVTGVAPGSYDFVIKLYDKPEGCLTEPVGKKIVAVEVKDDGEIKLGRIEVPCQSRPLPGSSIQDFGFESKLEELGLVRPSIARLLALGKKKELGLVDSKPKPSSTIETINRLVVRKRTKSFVLIHVWASWCQPCIDHMPEIKQTADNMKSQSVNFVGLNVDEDFRSAELLAKEKGWGSALSKKKNRHWIHFFIGATTSGFGRQELSVSVGTFYLYGPDGKLVTSTQKWQEVKKKLEESLEENSKK